MNPGDKQDTTDLEPQRLDAALSATSPVETDDFVEEHSSDAGSVSLLPSSPLSVTVSTVGVTTGGDGLTGEASSPATDEVSQHSQLATASVSLAGDVSGSLEGDEDEAADERPTLNAEQRAKKKGILDRIRRSFSFRR